MGYIVPFFKLLKIFSDKILCSDNFHSRKRNAFQHIEMSVIRNQKIGTSANRTINKLFIILICDRKLKPECGADKNHIFRSQKKKPEMFRQFFGKYILQNFFIFQQNRCRIRQTESARKKIPTDRIVPAFRIQS